VKSVEELYIEDRADAVQAEKLKLLDGVQAVFFSGGDQLCITSQIGDAPIFDRVHDIYRSGGIIAGTSAGASVIGEAMLVKGKRDSSFRLDNLHMAPGLGLLPNVIIDQHFAQRGRIGRLLGAVAHNPRVLGIGIDEDTAIVVEGTQFRVIGSGAVYVIDGAGVSHSNVAEGDPDAVLSIYDVALHVLSSGDGFNLADRRPMQMEELQKRALTAPRRPPLRWSRRALRLQPSPMLVCTKLSRFSIASYRSAPVRNGSSLPASSRRLAPYRLLLGRAAYCTTQFFLYVLQHGDVRHHRLFRQSGRDRFHCCRCLAGECLLDCQQLLVARKLLVHIGGVEFRTGFHIGQLLNLGSVLFRQRRRFGPRCAEHSSDGLLFADFQLRELLH
jgi:cyanophycinase